MSGNAWPQSAITALTALWATGASATQIGKRMGISRNAVIGKAHRLKLKARRLPHDAWTDEDLARFTALWTKENTAKKVAKLLRRTPQACADKAAELGIRRVRAR